MSSLKKTESELKNPALECTVISLVLVSPDRGTVGLEDGVLRAVVEVAGADVRVELEVGDTELLRESITLVLDHILSSGTLNLLALDPFAGQGLKFPHMSLPLVQESLLGLSVLHAIVLASLHGDVLVCELHE